MSGSADASSLSLTSLIGAIDRASGRHQPGGRRRGGRGEAVGHRLLHPQPVRFGHDDGLAFGGQQPLVGIQADRVDPDPRAVAQELDHPGQRPEPARPVEHHHDVGPESDFLPSRFARRLLPGADDGEQFGDPGRHRLRVVPDQRGAVLPAAGPAVRQPAGPLPAVLAR